MERGVDEPFIHLTGDADDLSDNLRQELAAIHFRNDAQARKLELLQEQVDQLSKALNQVLTKTGSTKAALADLFTKKPDSLLDARCLKLACEMKPNKPVTTKQVTEIAGCDRRYAYRVMERLEELAEEGWIQAEVACRKRRDGKKSVVWRRT